MQVPHASLTPSVRQACHGVTAAAAALDPHMNIEQSLRFGLEDHRLSKSDVANRVARAAEILQIGHLLARRPGQLSDGQTQCDAISRAIVKEPRAFLLDEPLSEIGAELGVKTRGESTALHRRLEATMVYVIHEHAEGVLRRQGDELEGRVTIPLPGRQVDLAHEAPVTPVTRPGHA